jgi:hypothetical protein
MRDLQERANIADTEGNETARSDAWYFRAAADALAAAQALLQARYEQLTAEFAISSRLAERGREAQARIAALEGALAEIAEHPGPHADLEAHWRSERARAALAPVSGFNEPTPHTPQYPPHVVPTWQGKGES